MFYVLSGFSGVYGPLRVFQYITVRTAFATIMALMFSILLGPRFIRALGNLRVATEGGREGMEIHDHKQGTPTMGGLLIVAALSLTMLLFGNFSNRYVPLVMLVTIGLAAVGFIDDFTKLVRGARGLSARYKLLGQLFISLTVGFALYLHPIEAGRLWESPEIGMRYGTIVGVPFLKNVLVDLSWFYIPFVALVIVGASNAVNLTDGLDGLAAGSTLGCTVALAGLSYLIGNVKFSAYLNVMYVRDVGELTVFLGALIGALLGFLWFNTHPAEVFMGDTGSLALGGIVGVIAVIIKQELLLVIIGGIFVAEALSVIIQVASYRLTGKRVFLMAPLHHHFEKKGWKEPKVIVRFWIVSFVLTMLAIATLKLR